MATLDDTTKAFKRLKGYLDKYGADRAIELAADEIVALEFELKQAEDKIGTVTVECGQCDGVGEVEDNGPKACPMCGGNGYVEI